MFTTQLVGRLKKIESDEQYSIEDGARLLAQALVGEGSIYIYAKNEMEGIYSEIFDSVEPLNRAKRLTEELIPTLSSADRVLLFTRDVLDDDILKVAKSLRETDIPFVAVGSCPAKQENPLDDLAHVFINLYMDRGLVPTETGGRAGFPHLIGALYVYHNIKIILDDMVEDFE